MQVAVHEYWEDQYVENVHVYTCIYKDFFKWCMKCNKTVKLGSIYPTRQLLFVDCSYACCINVISCLAEWLFSYSFCTSILVLHFYTHLILTIPAHDNDVSAGAGLLGLAEEVYQREYGWGVWYLLQGPAGQLQECDNPVWWCPLTLCHLQPPLSDVSIAAQHLHSDSEFPIHFLSTIHTCTIWTFWPEAITALLEGIGGKCQMQITCTYTNNECRHSKYAVLYIHPQ